MSNIGGCHPITWSISGSFGKKDGQLNLSRCLTEASNGFMSLSSTTRFTWAVWDFMRIWGQKMLTCCQKCPMMNHDPSRLQGDIMQRSRTCMAMHHSCFDGILRKNTHAYYFSMNSGKTKAGDCRPSSSAQRTPWKPVMSQVQCVGIDCPVNYDACQLFPAENVPHDKADWQIVDKCPWWCTFTSSILLLFGANSGTHWGGPWVVFPILTPP